MPQRVSAAVRAGSVDARSLRRHANGFTARPVIPLGGGLLIIAIGIAWPFILAVCVRIEESAVARLLDHCLRQHVADKLERTATTPKSLELDIGFLRYRTWGAWRTTPGVKLFGFPSWTGNEPKSRNPSGVPILDSFTAHGALKATDLARLHHVLAAVINRATLTGSMTRRF